MIKRDAGEMDRDSGRRARLGLVGRRVLLAVGLLILFGLSWTGVSGGVDQIPESDTPGQQAQTAAQIAYGLLSILTIVTTFRGHRWRRPIRAGWVVAVTVAGGLAPVVWGGSGLGIGLLAGAASLLIALAIIGVLRVGAGGQISA
jgi:hypothetical protein